MDAIAQDKTVDSHYMSLKDYQLLALRYRKILREDDKFHIGDEISNADLWAECSSAVLMDIYRDSIVEIATLQAKDHVYFEQDSVNENNANAVFKKSFIKSVMTLAKDVVTLQMLENQRDDLPIDLYSPLAKAVGATLSLDPSITNLAQDYLAVCREEAESERDAIEDGYNELPYKSSVSESAQQKIYTNAVKSKRFIL